MGGGGWDAQVITGGCGAQLITRECGPQVITGGNGGPASVLVTYEEWQRTAPDDCKVKHRTARLDAPCSVAVDPCDHVQRDLPQHGRCFALCQVFNVGLHS